MTSNVVDAAAVVPPARRTLPQRDRWRVRRPWHHAAMELLIRVLAGAAVLAIALVFVFVGKETLPLLFSEEVRHEVTLASMWFAQLWPGYDAAEHVWQPVSDVPKYGVWPLVVGSLKVTTLSMVVAAPIGVASAVWVSQYCPPRLRELIKPTIELLAGVPSVVLGFFALMVLATGLQTLLDLDYRLSSLLAGIALAVALIPQIFTLSEDALRAVPRRYVEASIALGARPAQTILRVVVPAAAPGIGAALALAFGRAVGETMIVLMAAGNAAILSASLTEPARTIPATIAAELAEVVFGGPHYTVLFFLGALLFVVTFVINTIAGRLIDRAQQRAAGVA